MNFRELRILFKSLSPIIKNGFKSGQLFNPTCQLLPADEDILCEFDVKIPMSEGFFLTANIFRSKKAENASQKVPVVMCAHPYDNHKIPVLKKTLGNGPPQQYRIIPQGGGTPSFSELTSWESPDPNFWVKSGYAVVNLNLPGFANSEGPPSIISQHQAKCYYEAIEWIAQRPWSTGKVGLNGVSFLAISQYAVAFTEVYGGPPPSLKCISPWEGMSDLYQDVACFGGVPDLGFLTFWWHTEVKGVINGTIEAFKKEEGALPVEYLDHHPNYDAFWKAKVPKLEKIDLPMLICASFSDHGLHTMGSFRAYEKAKSKHKWIYTHRTGKWVAYYSKEVQELTKKFMDCFLLDQKDNGFLEIPSVRLEVRSAKDDIREVRYEKEWPIARTAYKKLFLQPDELVLEPFSSETNGTIEYSGRGGRVVLRHLFKEDTELSGYLKLKLWVESGAKNSDVPPKDMNIFVGVKKYTAQNEENTFYGSVGIDWDMVTRGSLKVSKRGLNEEESRAFHPVYTGAESQFLRPGEVVPVEIALYPQSTFFSKNEVLELIVSSKGIIPSRPFQKSTTGNDGVHIIHAGGDYDSHLLIPIIPGA
ncbi:MAG: CocE/NonD family hydrolase [Bacteroidota bacterium]